MINIQYSNLWLLEFGIYLKFGTWNLEFICDLVLGSWNLFEFWCLLFVISII